MAFSSICELWKNLHWKREARLYDCFSICWIDLEIVMSYEMDIMKRKTNQKRKVALLIC